MTDRVSIGEPPRGADSDETGFSDVAVMVDSTIHGPSSGAIWTERFTRYAPAFFLFVVALLLWEGFVRAFEIQNFLLPSPLAIGNTFVENFDRLLHVGWFTVKEAIGGFIIGCSLGVLMALITSRWTAVSESLMPFAIAANSVPIIAFAPILNNWFGIDNPLSKMMIVAVIVFFPVMINTVRGLTLVDPDALELMRSYAANETQILFQLRFPNALPFMFNAFKVAAALSMIGAVVSEYFGGNRSALGVYITQEAAQFRFDRSWAAIVVACIAGITFFLVISGVERLVIPWHSSIRKSDS